MTTTTNPFVDDPVKAEVFEIGYLAGFQDPDSSDSGPPFAPDIMDAYLQGVDAGRTDHAEAPEVDASKTWVSKEEIPTGPDAEEP